MEKKMSNSLLEVKNLSAWYKHGQDVLHQIDLTIKENEVIGIIGRNGVGKTTLIQILASLHKGYSCQNISFEDCNINLGDEKFKKNRYIVFDEDESFEFFTFYEYIEFTFRCYNKKINYEEVDAMVDQFQFRNYVQILLKDLSLGNRRKVYLMTGFLLKVKLLIMDEPLNSLDLNSTELLYQLIREYKGYGTILFSSHVIESITSTVDKVIFLSKGTIFHIFEKEYINSNVIREVLRSENDV
jgi:ABC-2 type transport system ATP-binding protein